MEKTKEEFNDFKELKRLHDYCMKIQASYKLYYDETCQQFEITIIEYGVGEWEGKSGTLEYAIDNVINCYKNNKR